MVYFIGAVIIFLAVWGIVNAASGDRYADMTEEEFEEEAKRGSPASGMASAFQKIVDPSHPPEFAMNCGGKFFKRPSVTRAPGFQKLRDFYGSY